MALEPTGNPSGQPGDRPELTIARWGTRFWAWLVDFIIIAVAAEILFSIAYAPLAFNQGMQQNPSLGALKYAVQSLMFFGYWTYFDSSTGQSIGKKLLKIRTTNMAGGVADVRSVAIQSFGKAFLLPIDVLFGWIFTNDKRQRLLSSAAGTIVIKTKDLDVSHENVNYKRD